MRAFLLKSVAVTALVIGPSLAFAEGPGDHGPGGGGDHGGGAPAHSEGGAMHAQGGGAPMQKAPAGGGERKMEAPAKAEAPHTEPGKMQAAHDDKHPMGGPSAARPGGDHMKPAGDVKHPEAGHPEAGHPEAGHGEARHGAAKSAHVSSEQRTRMQSTFRSQHVERISHADFSVNIGGFVPRHYHYYPLPPAIFEIVPEYEGYDYVEVGDQILIIDPDSGEIVYVIDE